MYLPTYIYLGLQINMEDNNSMENEAITGRTGRLNLEIDLKNMPWLKEQIHSSKEDFYELILFNNAFSVSLKHKFRQVYIYIRFALITQNKRI